MECHVRGFGRCSRRSYFNFSPCFFLACERAKQVLLSTPPPMAYLWIESQYFGALQGLGWLIWKLPSVMMKVSGD